MDCLISCVTNQDCPRRLNASLVSFIEADVLETTIWWLRLCWSDAGYSGTRSDGEG